MSSSFRSGYVAIVGWPNVGKSTLLNAMLGAKLSIVAAQPQTTRESLLGILNEPGLQMIFVDTPGWLSPRDTFQSFMKRSILRAIFDDADVILWLIEPKPLNSDDLSFGETLRKCNKPIVVAINKMDISHSSSTMEGIEKQVKGLLDQESRIVRISAKTKLGLLELKGILTSYLPEGQAFFPTDQITDRWERFYVSELIREQIFKRFREEVPHAAAVVIEGFTEKAGRKDVINADIIVETEGQKRIILGKGGMGIRDLGQAARKEIETQIGRPVFLSLTVKIKKSWRQDTEFLKKISTLA